MSRETWQRRLWFTGIGNGARKVIIDLENSLVDLHGIKSDDFVEQLVDVHERRGRITPEDIVKAINLHLEGLSVTGSDLLRKSLESLHYQSRRDALGIAGFKREAIRKQAQTDDERREELERSFGLAFRGVTSLPDDVVDRIRQKIITNVETGTGTTEQVLRSIIEEESQGLQFDDPADLRAAIRKIWDKTKIDLQRVIRSESINAYSRVQLQEWADRGIRRVTRHSIDDDRTCAICRELSRPGSNIVEISDLLALDYPVTQEPGTGEWMTHPNCRCWFEPITEDVWEDLENLEAEIFSDISRGDATAIDVPVDSQRSVEKMLREQSDIEFDVQFVPSIVELPAWQEQRLVELAAEYGGDKAPMVLDNEIFLNTVAEWTSETGVHYVSGSARELDHMTAPVARAAGIRRWENQDFVIRRWEEKIESEKATIEEDGFQIFGGEPFYNEVAANSPEDYFIETYAAYMVQPYVLATVDGPMYDWLNEEIFGGREFLQRGGLK